MASTYPTTQDTFSTKVNGDVIDASHIDSLQDSVIALESNVGTTNSAVTTTIDYKLKNASSVNPGHKHTITDAMTDVVITSPSNGQGLVYESASGKWKNQTTSIADASTSTKGITTMSVAPVSAGTPIAVGDNDPRVTNIVTAQTTPNMTVAVKAFNIAELSYAGGNTGTITAPVTNPRIDLVVLTSAGTLAVHTGTEAVSPAVPTLTDGDIALAKITLATSTTSITNTLISNYQLEKYVDINALQVFPSVSMTAGEALASKDYVAITASNTVGKVVPNSITAQTATTVPFQTNGGTRMKNKSFNIDNVFLKVGCSTNGGTTYIEKLAMDLTETAVTQLLTQNVPIMGIFSNMRVDVCQLSSDKLLFVALDGNGASITTYKGIVYTISTNTFGSSQALSTFTDSSATDAGMSDVSLAQLGTDKALFFFRKSTDSTLHCSVLTVSGTTITTNTSVQVDSANTQYFIDSVGNGTDKAQVVYGGTSTPLKTTAITVSGTVPTIGTPVQIDATSGSWAPTVSFIATDKFLAIRKLGSVSSQAVANIITVSGTTSTVNADYNLLASATTNAAVNYNYPAIYGTKVAIIAPYIVGSGNLRFNILDISGTTITAVVAAFDSTSTYSSDTGSYSVMKLKNGKILIIGVNSGTPANTPRLFATLGTTVLNKLGVIQSNVANAGTATVFIGKQKKTGFTGLTAASTYYIDEVGQYTLRQGLNAQKYGIALNATDMVIE